MIAVIGQRQCSGSVACDAATAWQTTITGLSGGTINFIGGGRISGNGKYLLRDGDGSITSSSICAVVDLQTGQEETSEYGYAPPDSLGRGRAIADDGTAVMAYAYSLNIMRGPELTQAPVGEGSPSEAVIDSAARIVVYSFGSWWTRGRSLRIYRIAEQQDSALIVIPGVDSHAPYLSADGSRVMFLSDASGLPQIYTISTDGGEARQVTRDGTGVLSAAMSDDGRIAWYFSGSARLYRLDLDSGDAEQRLGDTPQIGLVSRMTPGSLYSILGAGFSDRVYDADSYPLPLAGRNLGVRERRG